MGRTILLGAGVAVLLLLAWLALGGREGADGPGPKAGSDATGADTLPPADEDASPPADAPDAGAEDATGVVTGTVRLDRDGRPVPGVTVRAIPRWPASADLATETRTDERGRYTLRLPAASWSLLPAGEHVVTRDLMDPWVEKEDLEVRVRAGRTVEIDLVVTRAATVRGRVVDDRRAPVAGARVKLSDFRYDARDVLRDSPVAAEADADGSFLLSPVPPGLEFRVRAEGPAGLVTVTDPLRVFGGQTAEVELRMPAAREVDVLVLEEGTDHPVADAELLPMWSPVANVYLGPERRFRTGADGRARIRVREEAVRLWVNAAGAIAHGRNVALHPGKKEITVRLTRAAFVAGRVVFPDGTPLTGERLTVHWVNAAGGETNWADLDPRPGPDGSFRVEGIPAGPVRISHRTVRDGRLYALDAEAETGREELRLVLEPTEEGGNLALVLDPAGRPVPFGNWRVNGETKWFANGQIEIWPPGSTRRVEVFAPRTSDGDPLPFGAGVFEIGFPENAPTVIRLPPEQVVEGRVLDAVGAPVGGVRLLFRPLGIEARHEEAAPHADVRTGPDGSFRAGRLGDLEYLVEVRPPGSFAPVEPLPVRAGDRDVRIRLAAGVRAVVTVLDADSRPVAGAEVRIATPFPDGAERARSWTDADGAAIFDGRRADEPLRLEVRAPRNRPDLPGEITRDWTPADTTVRFGRCWSLDLAVVDRNGHPVRGARVRWRVPPETTWHECVADPDGRVLLREVSGGRVVVRATAANGFPAAPGVEEHSFVAYGERKTVVVPRGRAIHLRVADWPRGDQGVLYLIAPDGETGRRYLRVVRSDGRVDLEGVTLPATVLLGTSDGSRWAVIEDLPNRDEIREVRLVPGETISGRLLLPDGATWGLVTLALPGGDRGKAVVEADGRFELTGVPPGRFTIRAITPAGTREVEATTGVPIEIDFR